MVVEEEDCLITPLEQTISRIQQGLKQDPRPGPKDYVFTVRVVEWVEKFVGAVREPPLQIAAWGHVLYRWKLPRGKYPMTTEGYHRWRQAQSELSANEVEKILKDEGIDSESIEKVRSLILKKKFPQDPDSRVLEDATCLVFLETKLQDYLDEWDDEKMKRILQNTWKKMTPKAQELALKISYPPPVSRVLKETLS